MRHRTRGIKTWAKYTDQENRDKIESWRKTKLARKKDEKVDTNNSNRT